MPVELYINASCVIDDHTVYKNGKAVWENKQGSVSEFLLSVYQHFNVSYPKFYKMDRLSQLGFIANEILLQNSFDAEKYQPFEKGIVLSNASASLDTDVRYFETTKEMASPALFVYTLPNIVTGEISIRHHFKGENAFLISEEFDAGLIEQYVSDLLKNNRLEVCVCGWVELMGEKYKAALYLVQKEQKDRAIIFSKDNLNKIYELENG